MDEKEVVFVGSTLKDLKKMPSNVRQVFSHGIEMARVGKAHPGAKVMKGFGGAGVLEIRTDDRGDTFRSYLNKSCTDPAADKF